MSQLREQAVKCVKRAWSFAKRQSLKLVVGAGLFALSTGTALANSKGAGGFSKATTELSSYHTSLLCNGTIFALITCKENLNLWKKEEFSIAELHGT